MNLKGELQLTWVILLDPNQGVEVLCKVETLVLSHFQHRYLKVITCVHGLHILKLNGLSKHHLVERTDEETVQELSMINRHACKRKKKIKEYELTRTKVYLLPDR